jgi:hypothetical protein
MKLIAGSSTGRRLRRRFTSDQILGCLQALDRSSLSKAAFAREHDLTYSMLLRWVQRRGSVPRRGRPPKLREVPLGSWLGAGRWVAEVVRPDGWTVRLAPDAPAVLVEQLLGAC